MCIRDSPKGVYSKKVINAVKKAGYSYAFSMDDDLITFRTHPLAIPRIGIDGSLSLIHI